MLPLLFVKSDSLRVDIFFGSTFAVDLAGVNKIIFRNCIRNKLFASDKAVYQ